jgi:transglutaminase-like putative cysteine protease
MALAKSIPIIAVLFFIFPRVQVPWARSWNPPAAMVGFSDSISPGDIASLSMSQETVMRVEFNDYTPPMNSMYWRGAVLELTDGFGWRKSAIKIIEDVPTAMLPLRSDYSITLEATFSKVLPTLEHTRMITTPNFRAIKNDRGVFVSQNTVATRIRYQGISSENWSGPTIKDPLALPELPPKTAVWLRLQNSEKQTYQQKLKTLKDFFTTNNFAYTRSPGKHRDLDDFLFENRNGFCEHFAGAYAVLARGLGIPARVITGYQGGEKNDSGNFIRVSQADAHAWVEVLDPKGTWKRIDPTFWMAPLRIELGALAFFQLEPSDFGLSPGQALNKLRNQNFGASFFTSLRNQLESLNYLWVRSLLEFDLTEQRRLIQYFAPQMGWWITILVGAIFLMRLIRRWFESLARESDIAVRHYLWLEKKLAKLGFKRNMSQPPVEFLDSVVQKRPELKHLVTQTTNMYRLERYKNVKNSADDWRRILRGWKDYFRNKRTLNN